MNFKEYEKRESELNIDVSGISFYGILWTFFPMFVVSIIGLVIAIESEQLPSFVNFLSVAVPIWAIIVALGALLINMVDDGYTKENRQVIWAGFKFFQLPSILVVFGIIALINSVINIWIGLILLFVLIELIYFFVNYELPESSKELYSHIAIEKGKAFLSAFALLYGGLYIIDKIVIGCKYLFGKYEIIYVIAVIFAIIGAVAGLILAGTIIYKTIYIIIYRYLWLNSFKYKEHMKKVVAKEKAKEAKKKNKNKKGNKK